MRVFSSCSGEEGEACGTLGPVSGPAPLWDLGTGRSEVSSLPVAPPPLHPVRILYSSKAMKPSNDY